MLSEADQARIAGRFGVYDHEWRYIACHVGEPSLVDNLLIYDDGAVLSLCAFDLTDVAIPVSWERIRAALGTIWDGRFHRLVHVWGVFQPQHCLELDGRLPLVDRGAVDASYEGEYTINLEDLAFAEERGVRKTLRQIRNSGVDVGIAPSGPLSSAQLRLIEFWRAARELSPLSVSAGQAIATFVHDRQSYTATASVDGDLLGFSVFTRPNEHTAVNLMSFAMRARGSRVDDALQWQSTLFTRDLGCKRFSLGYAGDEGLSSFKRKWGARPTGPAYRAALYAVDEVWGEAARNYAFAWNSRLHRQSKP